MKPKRQKIAIASLACSAIPAVLAVWGFWLLAFAPDSRKTSEDALECGLFALWTSPLVIVGLGLGAFARGYRLICLGLGFFSLVCWAFLFMAGGLH